MFYYMTVCQLNSVMSITNDDCLRLFHIVMSIT